MGGAVANTVAIKARNFIKMSEFGRPFIVLITSDVMSVMGDYVSRMLMSVSTMVMNGWVFQDTPNGFGIAIKPIKK